MRGVFTYSKQDIENLVREDLEARSSQDLYFGDVPVQVNIENNELVSVVIDVPDMDNLPLLDDEIDEDEIDEDEGIEDEDGECIGCTGDA